MSDTTFLNLLVEKDGLIKGPFGGDVKKSLFVSKSESTYKVYEQGVVLNKNVSYGKYYLPSEYVKIKLKRFLVEPGDILLTGAGTVGELFVVPNNAPKGIINQALLRIRLNEKIIRKDYFLYYFKHYIKSIISNINGDSVIPNLPPLTIIKSTKVIIPDIDVQENISHILSVLDKKIELNNKINAELENIAKLTYDYWFVQFDFPDTNGIPYKSSGGKMVWSNDLNRVIPEGWKVGSLLDIADYTNGIACQKYEPTNLGSLPVIKIKEMHEGFTSNSDRVRSDIPDKVIVYDGDVLFSWSASLEVMIWAGGKGGLNQHIFKVTSDQFPRSFYYFQLRDYVGHFKMMAENRKTTMGHITQEHLQQSRISIPPTIIIDELETLLSPILDQIVRNLQENQALIKLRDWLLPMLMSGQVRVSE